MRDNIQNVTFQVGSNSLRSTNFEPGLPSGVPSSELSSEVWSQYDQWERVKGHIKQRWGYLTDDSFMHSRVDWHQFVSVLERCTGESRQAIVSELNRMIDREPESEGSVGMGNHFYQW